VTDPTRPFADAEGAALFDRTDLHVEGCTTAAPWPNATTWARITHLPTGIQASSDAHRDGEGDAYAEALQRLALLVAEHNSTSEEKP